jgi:hypothetical protein
MFSKGKVAFGWTKKKGNGNTSKHGQPVCGISVRLGRMRKKFSLGASV